MEANAMYLDQMDIVMSEGNPTEKWALKIEVRL